MSDALLGTTALGLVIRASSLPQFSDCPRRWAARHLRREITAAGYELRETGRHIGACTGSATHVGAAFTLQHKIDTGELGNATEAEQRAMESLEHDVREGAGWDKVTPNLSDAQVQVRRQIGVYRLHVASTVKPVAVERRLRARHKSGITISGTQDLVITEPEILRDLKTGGHGPSVNAGQYGAYSALLRSHGIHVTGIIEDFVARVRPDHQQPRPVEIAYDIGVAERTTESIIRRITADVADFRRTGEPESFLANPQSVLCSDRYCPAWGTKWCEIGRNSSGPAQARKGSPVPG